MSVQSKAGSLLSQLQAQYDAGDVVGGQDTLRQIKIALLDFPDSNQEAQQALLQALELGVLLSMLEGDFDAFARNVAQLKPLYHKSATTPSPNRCHVEGLQLMHWLVEHRLSEFHASLELLSSEEASHPYVQFPLDLERQLMVGSYDQVLAAQVPHPTFQCFVDSLLHTVRDSIADCMEVSYAQMSLQNARTMMKFDSESDLLEYIQECREDWMILDQPEKGGKSLVFQPTANTSESKMQTEIPSLDWIAQSLSYATEMERII